MAKKRAATRLMSRMEFQKFLLHYGSNGSDREIALVLTATIEIYLKDAIINCFSENWPNSNNLQKNVKRDLEGFLRNSHILVALALSLGFIDAKEYRDLKRIYEIRNAFAHNPIFISSDDSDSIHLPTFRFEEIAEIVKQFEGPDVHDPLWRILLTSGPRIDRNRTRFIAIAVAIIYRLRDLSFGETHSELGAIIPH